MYLRIAPYKNAVLIDVLTPYLCEHLKIYNAITVNKIIQIATAIDRIREAPEDIKLSVATAIQFVLIVKKIFIDVTCKQILQVCNVDYNDVLKLAKIVTFYKLDIIKKYI